MAQRLDWHCSPPTQAEPSAPSVHTPPVSLALVRTHSPATQCSGLLQRSPTPPALHVQPAPAESCAQRASAQSASSALSQDAPTSPVVHWFCGPSEK